MGKDSPFRERKHGVRVQPWGLHAVTPNILFGFSDSPFNMSSCLTARLRTGSQVAVFISGQGGGHGN